MPEPDIMTWPFEGKLDAALDYRNTSVLEPHLLISLRHQAQKLISQNKIL
jgi:hypothetical protein